MYMVNIIYFVVVRLYIHAKQRKGLPGQLFLNNHKQNKLYHRETLENKGWPLSHPRE